LRCRKPLKHSLRTAQSNPNNRFKTAPELLNEPPITGQGTTQKTAHKTAQRNHSKRQPKPVTQEDIDAVVKLRKEGLGEGEIGFKLHLPKSTARNILKEQDMTSADALIQVEVLKAEAQFFFPPREPRFRGTRRRDRRMFPCRN